MPWAVSWAIMLCTADSMGLTVIGSISDPMEEVEDATSQVVAAIGSLQKSRKYVSCFQVVLGGEVLVAFISGIGSGQKSGRDSELIVSVLVVNGLQGGELPTPIIKVDFPF